MSKPATESGVDARKRYAVRAVATGMVLGATLSICNVYTGLKIGWSFNMSITAALLGYALWHGLHRTAGTHPLSLLDNNRSQTAASAAASVSSAGLVSAIPALTMLTGRHMSWLELSIWVLAVSVVGIATAVALRRQLLEVDALPFPSGIATATTLHEVHAPELPAAEDGSARAGDAIARVRALLAAAAVAAPLKVAAVVGGLGKLYPPGSIGLSGTAGRATLANLGFGLDPSLLLVGMGAIAGLRVGVSMLLGAVVAWAVIGPWAVGAGIAEAGDPDGLWYGKTLEWLLWPGVTLMVVAALTSLAFSWRSFVSMLSGGGGRPPPTEGDIPRRAFIVGVILALGFVVSVQVLLHGIPAWIAAGAALLSFGLAAVAGRVNGETGITPIGGMGKVTQLAVGAVQPGDVTANLMTANVAGGSAAQCGDLLADLKTGLLVGAKPRGLVVSQLCGVCAGAVVGTFAYRLLIPDPATQLLTEEWPAPAVAAWKAVAEVFASGIEAMPDGSPTAMTIAIVVGVGLSVAERTLPKNIRGWVPSPAAVGIAFIIPAYNSISLFAGAVIATVLAKRAPEWSDRFVVVIASGLIAGESLAGALIAVQQVLT